MSVLDELFRPEVRAAGESALRHLVGALPSIIDESQFSLEVDAAIVDLSERICNQVDEVIHHADIQGLESSWRGLKYLVDNVQRDEPVLLEFVSCLREELDEDLNESPEVVSSGIYSLVYRQAIGQYGEVPYGLICACFKFGPRIEDLTTLKALASISAMAHAPLFADADPDFFDVSSYTRLPTRRGFTSTFSGSRFAVWREFRLSEDARYVGLCLPRFLLRRPYDVYRESSMRLSYRETAERGARDLLWGNACLLATLIAAGSFSRYRWCVFLTGSDAGSAAPLLRWDFPSFSQIWSRCPLECLLTNRAERELAELGFIGFMFDRSRQQATMLSAPSLRGTRRATRSGAPLDVEVNEHLGGQLNYIFLICRLAHYIKIIQQEKVGSGLSSGSLERMLTKWITRYISDMENPSPEVLAARPLRGASIHVEVVEGQTGWYRCHLRVRPHLTHNNATFTLALVGKLDRRAAGGAL